jgi:citrate/tricarballylate utilization protein
MQKIELLEEAKRQMGICNACRYCEGFCAVFPAMELRRSFNDQDVKYLANLCHNCRGCYYACQYAPPHEFAVNLPKTFTELRLETYQEFTWPHAFAGLFKRNGLAVTLITVVSVVGTVLLTLLFQNPALLFSSHIGEGAFYAVVPYAVMVWPALAISLFIVIAFAVGMVRFWYQTGGTLREFINPGALITATCDALRLKYLKGGGHGCNYPEEQFSSSRRWLHHLVFYGFMLTFASTTVAAIYRHIFQWDAPYPYLSLPVVLGTVGGVGIIIGTVGLLLLKRQMDSKPASQNSLGMDVGFLVLLFLTSLTGLVLLAFRETAAMGMLLAVHLGIVMALFFTLPYGKFVHAIYRFAALVRHSLEQRQ